MKKSQISFFNLAVFEKSAQILLRFFVFRKQNNSGSVFVEPMHHKKFRSIFQRPVKINSRGLRERKNIRVFVDYF